MWWDFLDFEGQEFCASFDPSTLYKDDDLLACSMVYLSPTETVLLKVCWCVSLLSFLYSSCVLLQAIFFFGLDRCQQKLRTWTTVVHAKFVRLWDCLVTRFQLQLWPSAWTEWREKTTHHHNRSKELDKQAIHLSVVVFWSLAQAKVFHEELQRRICTTTIRVLVVTPTTHDGDFLNPTPVWRTCTTGSMEPPLEKVQRGLQSQEQLR